MKLQKSGKLFPNSVSNLRLASGLVVITIMKESPKKPEYQPVSCSLYDELELACIKNRVIEITYSDNDVIKTKRVVPVNVYSRNKVEYLKFDDGEELRLDYIRQIRVSSE